MSWERGWGRREGGEMSSDAREPLCEAACSLM